MTTRNATSSVHVYASFESPLGNILFTAYNGAITGVYFPNQCQFQQIDYDPKPFQAAFKQLDEYFSGRRHKFDLPLAPLSTLGTPFQKRVWEALTKINYGETKSYGEIALSINQPTAARAVGMAISKNPLGIIVPCHRVIGANGKLTGFAGGIAVKEWLLKHEEFNLQFTQ